MKFGLKLPIQYANDWLAVSDREGGVARLRLVFEGSSGGVSIRLCSEGLGVPVMTRMQKGLS